MEEKTASVIVTVIIVMKRNKIVKCQKTLNFDAEIKTIEPEVKVMKKVN